MRFHEFHRSRVINEQFHFLPARRVRWLLVISPPFIAVDDVATLEDLRYHLATSRAAIILIGPALRALPVYLRSITAQQIPPALIRHASLSP